MTRLNVILRCFVIDLGRNSAVDPRLALPIDVDIWIPRRPLRCRDFAFSSENNGFPRLDRIIRVDELAIFALVTPRAGLHLDGPEDMGNGGLPLLQSSIRLPLAFLLESCVVRDGEWKGTRSPLYLNAGG